MLQFEVAKVDFQDVKSQIKGIILHFGKFHFSLSYRDQKIGSTLLLWSLSQESISWA